MSDVMSASQIKRLAGLEINDLLHAAVLPTELFDGTRAASAGTTIYDINGEVLYNRVPFNKGSKQVAYADIAVNPLLGSPIMAVSHGAVWDEKALVDEATKAARRRRRSIKFNKVRFVAYSYPKIAIQFLRDGQEVLMLELYSWKPVPKLRKRKAKEPPSNFERWSLLDELPRRARQTNIRRFNKRLSDWEKICPERRPPRKFRPFWVRLRPFKDLVRRLPRLPISLIRSVRYAPYPPDHATCYELRGQLTGVWCVAASVQMILDFYRYNYDQDRLAKELGLGTRSRPNGLPYSRDGDVVKVLEKMTRRALNASMTLTPSWAEFVREINANRPLISFVPGHSRTVAGYVRSISVFRTIYRGLLVYDPWPPSPTGNPTDGGVITRWENFDTHTYRRTFTARLRKA